MIENSQIAETDPVAAALWTHYEKEKKSLVIPIDSEELYRFGLPRTYAVLNRRGICYQGLWYVSEEYKKLLEKHNIGEQVKICYDPEDVSHLFLCEGMEYVPFHLSRESGKYAGVTENEYRKKKRSEKERLKDLEQKDTEGRVRLLNEIESVVKQAEHREKGKVSAKRMELNRERERI